MQNNSNGKKIATKLLNYIVYINKALSLLINFCLILIQGLSNYEEALENFLYVLADTISKKKEALDFVVQK